ARRGAAPTAPLHPGRCCGGRDRIADQINHRPSHRGQARCHRRRSLSPLPPALRCADDARDEEDRRLRETSPLLQETGGLAEGGDGDEPSEASSSPCCWVSRPSVPTRTPTPLPAVYQSNLAVEKKPTEVDAIGV